MTGISKTKSEFWENSFSPSVTNAKRRAKSKAEIFEPKTTNQVVEFHVSFIFLPAEYSAHFQPWFCIPPGIYFARTLHFMVRQKILSVYSYSLFWSMLISLNINQIYTYTNHILFSNSSTLIIVEIIEEIKTSNRKSIESVSKSRTKSFNTMTSE